jgi:hypothetical protein
LQVKIEGVRALRRQPVTASVNAGRHLDFRIIPERGMAGPLRGLSLLAGYRGFSSPKYFHNLQLAADVLPVDRPLGNPVWARRAL